MVLLFICRSTGRPPTQLERNHRVTLAVQPLVHVDAGVHHPDDTDGTNAPYRLTQRTISCAALLRLAFRYRTGSPVHAIFGHLTDILRAPMTIPVLQNTSQLADLLPQPHSIPASLAASSPTIRRVVRIMPQLGDVIVSPALVDTYAALNIIGIALLTLLTITFLIAPRKKLHRDPTLINAFVVLIWVGVWNIVYWAAVGTDIGVWESARRPKRRLCEVQSYVLAGSQPAQAATVFALTFRVRRRRPSAGRRAAN